MSAVYCPECRARKGFEPVRLDGPLLKTDYQREKLNKHTRLDSDVRLQSLFLDPSTSTIRVQVEQALGAGPVEIDDRGRVNYFYLGPMPTGIRHESGVPTEDQDAVVVVCSSNVGRLHAFTESAARLQGRRCAECGVSIVADQQ